jgi:DNA-binding Lrp family transcriptional regulator
MGANHDEKEMFDEIDRQILDFLSHNPRIPYSNLAEQLEERGHEMSSEGIRYRVSKILETTSIFFLLDPRKFSWEIIRLGVTTVDEDNAKENTFQMISDMPFWHVSRGIGTYDIFAVGSAPSMNAVDTLITTIRESEFVRKAEYIVVTDRNRDMESYLSLDYIPSSNENKNITD